MKKRTVKNTINPRRNELEKKNGERDESEKKRQMQSLVKA